MNDVPAGGAAKFVMFHEGDAAVFDSQEALERYVEEWYAREVVVFDRAGQEWCADVVEGPSPRIRTRFGLELPSGRTHIVFSLKLTTPDAKDRAAAFALGFLSRIGAPQPAEATWGVLFEELSRRCKHEL